MSRAFVKETDQAPEPAVARPASNLPRYITPAGLAVLHERLAAAERAGDAREAEDLRARIEEAVPVEPAGRPQDTVAFGATVTVEDEYKRRSTYTIVGEDEADPHAGTISWRSPLADALLDHRVGDRVTWQRPAGNLSLAIRNIEYRA